MSNRIYFDKNRHPGWFVREEAPDWTADGSEELADKILADAGLIKIGDFSTGGYRFKDPHTAAAVLRLAGFEVMPWE